MEHHGCYNRKPFADSHVVQSGWNLAAVPSSGRATRTPRMIEVPNVNSRDCQYTKANPDDPRCAGCSWQASAPDTQSAGGQQQPIAAPPHSAARHQPGRISGATGEILDTIENRVKRVIAEQLGTSTADMKPEHSFIDDLGADSLDEVELVMAIEDEFDIEIPDDEAEKIKTVQQAIDYVTGKVPA